MPALQGISLKWKFRAVTFLTTLATLLFGIAFAAYAIRSSRQSLVRQLSTQAEIIGFNSQSALVFHDERAAAETLAALRAEPQIAFAGVFTPEGKPFATYSRGSAGDHGLPTEVSMRNAGTPRFREDRLEITRLIGAPDKPVGMVYLRADLLELKERVVQVVVITGVFLALSLIASIGLSAILQKTISAPLLDLVRVSRNVAVEKNYGVRASPRNRDEVGILVEAFNEMLDQIQLRQTELRTLNRQLSQRTDELARKNEEVEAFVYIVSHDLRGPLVNLQGFSHELERSCQTLAGSLRAVALPPATNAEVRAILEKEVPDALRFILASSSKFERLINALLQLSRSGRQEYRHESLDMAALVATTLDSVRVDVEKSGCEVALAELPPARGDATAVGQVLSNLILNALRYLQPGRPGRIAIGGETAGRFNRYWVRDNGVGIPESAKKKMFQVFQRFHPKLAAGDGMGLATVKRIVERHGGRVWADSEEGVGTTFLFVLPADAPVSEEAS